LVGQLAARARHLQAHLDGDLEARLALDRLRKYRQAARLAPVVGLMPERTPEFGSWSNDAGRWWSLLTEGLRQ
jgi:hypothetical protein